MVFGLLATLAVLLAACSNTSSPSAATGESGQEVPAAAQNVPYVLDGPLTLQAFGKDRQVQPDTDQAFEFMLVNNTSGDLPVVLSLEHEDGVRWRTSLCVELQCILGNGTEPSVTEVVMLPSYLEKPFQAHVFVDAAAQAGQRETLRLRVTPQVDGVENRDVTLSAVVASP